MSRAHNTSREVKYVYDLPYTERKQLCSILDSNNDWERLGGAHMNLKWSELEEFRRSEKCGESPTNRLLQVWGQQNHTVMELFLHLWQMEHFQAMRAIQTCIPEKYHRLFNDAETCVTGVFVEKKPVKGIIIQEPHDPMAAVAAAAAASRSQQAAQMVNNSATREPTTHSSYQQTTEQHQNYSMEGACALDPSHNHNQNLEQPDQKLSTTNYHSTSKVPISLLRPAPDRSSPATTTSTISVSTYHHAVPQSRVIPSTPTADSPKPDVPPPLDSKAFAHLMPTAAKKRVNIFSKSMQSKKTLTCPPEEQVETKINNIEGIRTVQTVSCEDNNKLKSKSSNDQLYNPDQDYLNKVEEKRAKEAIREGQSRRTSERSTSTSSNSSVSIGQTGAAAVSPVQRHQEQQQQQQQQQTSSSRKISNVSDPGSPCSSVPVIPYKELEEATALWSQQNLLGRGGFGAVYKGTWKNTEVAIKRIKSHGHAHMDNTSHITQSLEELKLLQSYRHDNILQVYGYSTDHELYPCLVYQFMPHGSLEDRLQCRRIEAFHEGSQQRGSELLGWRLRFRIAMGTAGALQFLHTVKDKPLIHGDVKSANILLDQNYEPKLGDFGLAREGKSQSTSIKVSRVHGTKPYLPGDYLRSKKLSVKVDTYSFGIVLFELCTGLRAYDDKRKKSLGELVEEGDQELLPDSKIAGTPHEQEVFPFLFKLGKDCVQQRASMRPDMTAVFKDLDNYKLVMEEQARAKRISMGESSSVYSSPHLLQVRYDTAGSLQSPSTLPSSSPGQPRSPIPPASPHYYPHSPLLHPAFPGKSMNGQVGYFPRMFPPPHQQVWMAGPADTMAALPPSHSPRYCPPHSIPSHPGPPPEQRDPPSYSEAISQPRAVPPVIPQLSELNINSNSGSVYSDESESRSSMGGNTTQYTVPTMPSQYQTPTVLEEGATGGAFLPLLTELNNTDTTST